RRCVDTRLERDQRAGHQIPVACRQVKGSAPPGPEILSGSLGHRDVFYARLLFVGGSIAEQERHLVTFREGKLCLECWRSRPRPAAQIKSVGTGEQLCCSVHRNNTRHRSPEGKARQNFRAHRHAAFDAPNGSAYVRMLSSPPWWHEVDEPY